MEMVDHNDGIRPGQKELNELERAILARIAEDHSDAPPHLTGLRVLSREYTGVGSFTHFARVRWAAEEPQQTFGLNGQIRVPGVPSGLGAVLFVKGSRPDYLEVFAYADPWDGTFQGFSFEA